MASGGEHGDHVGSNGVPNGVVHQKLAAPAHGVDSVRLAASELITWGAIPGTLAALVRLNVFEALAAAGDGARLTAEELAKRATTGKPLNVAYLGRLLRMMSCAKILSEEVTTGEDGRAERRFGLEPIGKFFVEDPVNGSLVNLMHWMLDPMCLRTWDHLHESVVDDSLTPFARANGGLSPWECGMKNPKINMMFNKAMGDISKLYMRAILDAYPGFEEVKVLVDVGGGSGYSLSFITARYPHIKGINFDMPHVVAACPEIPGVEHVGGDFRESVPDGADTIFMKLILHDWDDANCVLILKNCFKALPAHGKVIFIDTMLPESSVFQAGDNLAFELDVGMMNMYGSNARERTEGEFRKLVLDSGFQQFNVICRVDHLTITELRKA